MQQPGRKQISPKIFGFIPALFFGIILFFISYINAEAQQLTSSVYSRFGVGEPVFKGFAHNISLGQSGTAHISPFNLNYNNPASNRYLKLTTFTVGVSGIYAQQQNAVDTATQNAVAFAYIAFGFPLTKWWGTSLGLIPYSQVSYSFKDTITAIGRSVENIYKGKGGLNKVYWANGFNPFKIFSDSIMKGFSLGVNAEFAFGNIIRTSSNSYLDADTAYYLNVQNETRKAYKGFGLSFGLLQTLNISDENKLTFGFTYGLRSNLNVETTSYFSRYFHSNISTNLVDTAYSIIGLKSVYYLPREYKFAVCYQSQKFTYTIEARLNKWGSDTISDGETSYLKDSRSFMAGIQYYPSSTSINGMLKHTYYRVGFRNAILPYYLNQTQIRENAISLGFGFPLRNSTSTVNLGVELGQRGTILNGLIRERYVLLNLAFTINDRWFTKSKLD